MVVFKDGHKVSGLIGARDMSNYLSADELADLIDCEPNSTACMKRWLDRYRWPYELNRKGFPKVSRVYYNARMSGQIPTGQTRQNMAEPDFSAL